MDRTPAAGRLPILTFHALDDADHSVIAFAPDALARAFEALHRLGARTMSVEAVGAGLRAGSLPPRAVALTFDDGYRSVYEVAFPLLQRYDFTATVFLTVGRGGTGPQDAFPSMHGRSMLRWGEVQTMHRAGVTFGAHTVSHPDLTRLALPQAREEIRESRARLEEALGSPVTSFAYPYGAVSKPIRRIVAEHFACACSDRLGLITPHSDPHALERVDAHYLRSAALVELIFSTPFAWYLRARALPRGVRRRLQSARSHGAGSRSEQEAPMVREGEQ